MSEVAQLRNWLQAREYVRIASFARERWQWVIANAHAAYISAVAFAEVGAANEAIDALTPHAESDNVPALVPALLGRLLTERGDTVQGLDFLSRACEREPLNPEMWLRRARVAMSVSQAEVGLRGAEVHAIARARDKDHAVVYASLLARVGRTDEARIAFERARALAPSDSELASIYLEFIAAEYPTESLSVFDELQSQLQTVPITAAIIRANVTTPTVFADERLAAATRASCLQRLRSLRASLEHATRADVSCLDSTPFFLSAHDADVTEHQFAWGDIVERVVSEHRQRIAAPRVPHKRRIGVVSNRITNSSAGRFFNGWIETLIERGYDVVLYAIGPKDEATDRLARSASLRHVPQDAITQFDALAKTVADDACAMLYFPEPQGSPLTMAIAALRLAPIQIAAFGNPLTTGLSTIDYFVVPDAAEIAAPAAYYRERVVRLAGVGAAIDRAPFTTRFSRESFGFRETDHVYLCTQRFHKWTPGFCESVIEILSRDSAGVLVYVDAPGLASARAFEMMLRQRFQSAHLDYAARTRRYSMLDRETFLNLNSVADVALDTMGFGGGATTVDSLSAGLPVVSLEGQWLRGRQTAGILRAAGLHENVVASRDAFVHRANEVAAVRVSQSARREHADVWWQAFSHSKNSAQAAVSRDVFASFADFVDSLEI